MTTLDLDPDRARRAAAALSTGAVDIQREGDSYRVRSFTADRQYTVRLDELRCDCPDATYRNKNLCKHLIATALARGLNGVARE